MGGIYGEHHLAAHLTSLDIIVNPSLRAWAETFCIANAEAFASGASLVSFGVGGVGEYFRPVNTHPQHSSSSVRITHDHSYSGSDNNSCSSDSIGNGVLATTATAQSLAEGVLHVLANGALRRKMNFNARRTVCLRERQPLEK
jgi:glycosyltransferase involved in cell wall biosynthesis